MCAIIGAVLHHIDSPRKLREANLTLEHIWHKSHERGRDGRGYKISPELALPQVWKSVEKVAADAGHVFDAPSFLSYKRYVSVIGNTRAEPTTEFVAKKAISDQQPYGLSQWGVVHNGTIANDKALRTGRYPTEIDSAAIVEQLALRSERTDNLAEAFYDTVRALNGSYAILATHESRPNTMFVACNYRPVWFIKTELGYFFASSRDYFPANYTAEMLPPYTVARFDETGVHSQSLHTNLTSNNLALVVCSGGLDSVVSAAYAQKEMGLKIHLIHFLYGSRAEGPEVTAIKAVAEALGAELTLFPLYVYSQTDSPLLDPNAKLAGGEAGAEFASEWVPARNLVLLSVATAFAEARGIETIVLGNNLEEAGAYPDNEPEFINRFNDMLPFAVGDGKRMRVIMPVGNMMKHEIVALGNRVGAPMHLTWSCYRAGGQHCGKCGPCYMRRKAFEINNLPEVISYESE